MATPSGDISKCIECASHDRICEIQGIVDNSESTTKDDEILSARPKRIYKRRRSKVDSRREGLDSPPSDDDEVNQLEPRAVRPRIVKISVDRMDTVADRLAGRSQGRPKRSTERDIALMDAFEKIGVYDYVAACNGILHDYESQAQNACDADFMPSTENTAQCEMQRQHELEKEITSKTTSPLLSQIFNNKMVGFPPLASWLDLLIHI